MLAATIPHSTWPYDNEAGKGDHIHWGDNEKAYKFSTPDKLMADFFADLERWNDENRDS